MIDDIYKNNKHNLIKICAALHKGIKLGVKVIETCYWNFQSESFLTITEVDIDQKIIIF